MLSFDIGLSALTASQRAMDLASQNLANASTPGYHRQSLILSPRVAAGGIGLGVEVNQIRRHYSTPIERAVTNNVSRTGRTEAELSAYRRLETLYTPGTGTVSDRTAKLFDSLAQLTARPDDVAQRRVVLNTAVGLTGELNDLGRSLSQARAEIRTEIDDSVATINESADKLADYNRQIDLIERSGVQANELRDQRDAVLNELAGQIDVRVIDQPYGVITVLAGNTALVVGSSAAHLETSEGTNGAVTVQVEGTTSPLQLTQGALAGKLLAHDEILTGQEPALDEFARELAGRLDELQATGLGLNGPVTQSLGGRGVSSTTDPLATATPFDAQAGSLFLSVTDQSTGQRVLQEVPFDPTTQSLQDLASAITTASGGQVQGSVTTDNRLQLEAQSGFAFDFAGRVPSSPTNVAMNGTAIPTVTGSYTGTGNGTYSVQIVGSGTVGSGSNLRLEARDINNNLVASLNIGQGYVPGTPLSIGNGLTVRLGGGTTSAGSFTVPVVATPDTTGSLAALGVGSLFEGSTALDLKVRQELVDDPRKLAGSRDGQPGDASNFLRMEAVRDQRVLSGGTQTLEDRLADLASAAGSAVQTREDERAALTSLGLSLQTQQQSVSGVDPNEEALSLVQSQRQFQMAARFISVVNEAMDELLNIIR